MLGILKAICIAPIKGGPMQSLESVMAITGAGLEGDRYSTGEGSFNTDKIGLRQVTLMNTMFFPGSGFEYHHSRRNLFVEGVELMWLIGRDTFTIGGVVLKAVKYCDPCLRPSNLSGIEASFKEAFFDRGGIIAEVIEGGILRIGDEVIPPPKGY